MTCGAMPLAPCTLDDVTVGLAQLSEQLQNLSAYLVIVTGIALFFMTATVILLWVNGRA